ncbi:hypothetical protein CSE16_13555 [Solibacillus sp. R5-41]|uniref:hypothetical protein n=1 Tax=Solibacillus sp. R5-41 TaxID=2048654 RepID=UPI000C124D24|nr:hypothetical protein [Solibacillus sp. R5-41]ATP40997.1 hypothetical protein CSE16_13555 [Solibacillus sp. R5-41]
MNIKRNLTWIFIIVGMFFGGIITVALLNIIKETSYLTVIPLVLGGIISWIIFSVISKFKNSKKVGS